MFAPTRQLLLQTSSVVKQGMHGVVLLFYLYYYYQVPSLDQYDDTILIRNVYSNLGHFSRLSILIELSY